MRFKFESVLLLIATLSAVSVMFAASRNVPAKGPSLNFGDNAAASTVIVTGGGHGSGVYIGNGRVITAAHVLKHADANGQMDVSLVDGGGTVKGTVKWYDEATDVGLIVLDFTDDPEPMYGLKPSKLACTTPDVSIGDEIEVIGAPLGWKNIHTYGHVASVVGPRDDNGVYEGQVSFVADITVTNGNSGGPAFNVDGTIAGIASAVAFSTINGMSPFQLPYAIIIPKSVICQQLNVAHPAPTFDQSNAQETNDPGTTPPKDSRG